MPWGLGPGVASPNLQVLGYIYFQIRTPKLYCPASKVGAYGWGIYPFLNLGILVFRNDTVPFRKFIFINADINQIDCTGNPCTLE